MSAKRRSVPSAKQEDTAYTTYYEDDWAIKYDPKLEKPFSFRMRSEEFFYTFAFVTMKEAVEAIEKLKSFEVKIPCLSIVLNYKEDIHMGRFTNEIVAIDLANMEDGEIQYQLKRPIERTTKGRKKTDKWSTVLVAKDTPENKRLCKELQGLEETLLAIQHKKGLLLNAMDFIELEEFVDGLFEGMPQVIAKVPIGEEG